jgi:hypothetical protein
MKKTTTSLQLHDVIQIRKLLPYDWRLQITNAHPEITTRQISETFYLRTRNAVNAEIVFATIAGLLKQLNHHKLARKCMKRIEHCNLVQSVAAA